MKTHKKVASENPHFTKLIADVVKTVGLENISDLARYGANTGFPGITYYEDTHNFAMRNRPQIIKLLEMTAQDFGQSVYQLVTSFRMYDQDMEKDLFLYLGGGKPKDVALTNLICWFACEEVARWFED